MVQDTQQDQLVALILRTARAMVDRLKPDQVPGFTLVHGVVVHHVAEHDDVTITDLARHLKVTKQSASELVQALESSGFVERVPHPRDGRAQILRLTDLGRERLADGNRRWQELEDELVELVGRDRIEVVREVLRTYLDTRVVTTA